MIFFCILSVSVGSYHGCHGGAVVPSTAGGGGSGCRLGLRAPPAVTDGRIGAICRANWPWWRSPVIRPRLSDTAERGGGGLAAIRGGKTSSVTQVRLRLHSRNASVDAAMTDRTDMNYTSVFDPQSTKRQRYWNIECRSYGFVDVYYG